MIEYIKTNASVFLNIEYIANDTERQRCVDMLSGAAYTLGCTINRISARGMYLISAPTVCVVMDSASQKASGGEAARGYAQQTYPPQEQPYAREPEQPIVNQAAYAQGFAYPQQAEQPQQPVYSVSAQRYQSGYPEAPAFPSAQASAKYSAQPPASSIPRTPAATGYGRRAGAYQQ